MRPRSSRDSPSPEHSSAKRAEEAKTDAATRFPLDGGRKLAELVREERIDSTKSLVAVYNSLDDERERATVRTWLGSYVMMPTLCVDPNNVFEFAELAKIKIGDDADKILLAEVLRVACAAFPEGKFAHSDNARAVHRLLTRIDASAFETAAPLVEAAERIIGSFSPKPRLKRANFADHEPTFLAMHDVFVLMHRVCRAKLTTNEVKGIAALLRRRSALMTNSRKYYPVRYHLLRLEQAAARLEAEDPVSVAMRAVRTVVCGVWAVVYVARGIALCACADSPRQWISRLDAASASLVVSRRKWYDALEALSVAGVEAAKEGGRIESVAAALEAATECSRGSHALGEDVALKFGIVDELTRLYAETDAVDIRDFAVTKLVEMGSEVARPSALDSALFEPLLYSLYTVHSGGEHRTKTDPVLQLMASCDRPRAKLVVKEWLGNVTLDDKLKKGPARRMVVEGQVLFRATAERIGILPLDVIHENLSELKSNYQTPLFCTVRPKLSVTIQLLLLPQVGSLFQGARERHVKDLEYSIVCYKEENVSRPTRRVRDRVGNGAGEREDHAELRRGRRNRTKKPIGLEDLFKIGSLKIDGSSSEVHTVVLYGDPGAGKTCISKTIAHGWSIGAMMKEYAVVFLLPVREVRSSKYNNSGPRMMASLEVVVANVCFPYKSDGDFEVLLRQIKEDLNSLQTLLILDGLDERDTVADKIVHEAKRQRCNLLFLSRPYNIEAERAAADVEAECVGFDHFLLERFVKQELPGDDGERLFLQLTFDASLTDIARIPVTASILCSLWRERQRSLPNSEADWSVIGLYSEMVAFVWRRYRGRPGTSKISRGDVFDALERIALEAFEEGQIVIEQGLLEKHSDLDDTRSILMDSGFLLFQMEGQEYQFPHLTFQEYFAGSRIARMLLASDKQLNARAEELLTANKYSNKYGVIFSFMSGLTAEVTGTKGLEQIFRTMNKEFVDVLGVHQLLCKLKVYNDFLRTQKRFIKGALLQSEAGNRLVFLTKEILRRCRTNSAIFKSITQGLMNMPSLVEEMPDIIEPVTNAEVLEKWLKEENGPTILIGIVKHSPSCLETLWEDLLELLRKEDYDLRVSLVQAIEALITVKPESSDKKFKVLLRCLNDSMPSVRNAACRAVADVAKRKPRFFPEIMDALVRSTDDSFFTVRMVAVQALGALLKTRPEPTAEALEALVKQAKDTSAGMTVAAVHIMGDLADAKSRAAEEALESFAEVADPESQPVCVAEMCAIGELARLKPDLAERRLARLAEGVQDASWDVRDAAMHALNELAHVRPESTEAALAELAQGAQAEDSVEREAALRALWQLAKLRPNAAEEYLSLIVEAIEDEDFYAYEVAMLAIGELAMLKLYPVQEALEILAGGAVHESDPAREVSIAAMANVASLATAFTRRTLEAVVEVAGYEDPDTQEGAVRVIATILQNKPEFGEEALQVLVEGATRAPQNVRTIALEAIRGYSFESIAGFYTKTPSRFCAYAFCLKLLQTPLVFSRDREGLMVAGEGFPTPLDTSSVSHAAMLEMIETAKGVFEESCPGIFDLLAEASHIA